MLDISVEQERPMSYHSSDKKLPAPLCNWQLQLLHDKIITSVTIGISSETLMPTRLPAGKKVQQT